MTLPQNLFTSPGTLYEDFETTVGWTATGSAVLSNDVTNFRTGTQSLKITTGSGTAGGARKTINWDMSNSDRLSFWIYLYGARTDFSGIAIKVSNDVSLANSFTASMSVNATLNVPGWNRVDAGTGPAATSPIWWTQANAGTWTQPMIRLTITVTPQAGKVAVASMDDLRWGYKCLPAVMFEFNDGYESTYTKAFPILKPHNMRATIYPITTWIDGIGITWAELATLSGAGWTIGNGTYSHPYLNTLTLAQQIAEFTDPITALNAHGLPNGVFFGQTAYAYTDLNDDTFTAMATVGMLTEETGQGYFVQRAVYLPPPRNYEVDLCSITSAISLATAKAYVDNAIANKTLLLLSLHDFDIAGQWTISNFQQLVDYIYIKAKAEPIYIITIDDYYKLTLGPVRVPKIR